MPTINLSLPASGTVITAGLHVSNYTAIQTLLNGGLDENNVSTGIVSKPSGIASGEVPAWNGSGWARSTTTKIGVTSLATPPMARVYNDNSQTLTTGVYTALAFNQENFDTDGIHDNATNNSRLTAQTAGTYLITGNVLLAGHATGLRLLTIRHQGVTDIAHVRPVANANGNYMLVTTTYSLAAADRVELIARQDSGGNLQVEIGSHFSMVRIGAAT